MYEIIEFDERLMARFVGGKGGFDMDILVMGNGFDLEHKIPSSYKNFLNFIETFNNFYKYKDPAPLSMPPDKNRFRDRLSSISPMYRDVASLISGANTHEASVLKEFYSITEGNQWIDYFQRCLKRRSEYGDTYNWVDIEEEIADVVINLTEYEQNYGYMPFYQTEVEQTREKDGMHTKFAKDLINTVFERVKENDAKKINGVKGNKTYRELQKDWILFTQRILEDFNKAVRALEIYLGFFVDFDKIKPSTNFEGVKFDRFLTFNYTDTYQMIYKTDKYDRSINGDFVHGKADWKRVAKKNNMVVGIEEFLSDEKKDKNIEFVDYRKYYQRIVKRCDFSYHGLLQKEKDIATWFVGHSMAATDRDILRKLLPMRENNISKSYVCYYDDNAFRQEVVNLAQILGQDYLTEITCGAEPKIVFLNQTEIKKYMQEKIRYDVTRAVVEGCSAGRR